MDVSNKPPEDDTDKTIDTAERIQHAQRVKAQHEHDLMSHPGVVGVGIGYRQRDGELDEDEIVIVIRVQRKKHRDELTDDDLLPTDLDGVPTDVQEGGQPGPLAW
jgi:hypothetical protein